MENCGSTAGDVNPQLEIPGSITGEPRWSLHPSSLQVYPSNPNPRTTLIPSLPLLCLRNNPGDSRAGHSPFDVDVAHLLPGDAEVIQDHVLGVPDDAAQVEPGKSRE